MRNLSGSGFSVSSAVSIVPLRAVAQLRQALFLRDELRRGDARILREKSRDRRALRGRSVGAQVRGDLDLIEQLARRVGQRRAHEEKESQQDDRDGDGADRGRLACRRCA